MRWPRQFNTQGYHHSVFNKYRSLSLVQALLNNCILEAPIYYIIFANVSHINAIPVQTSVLVFAAELPK